MKKKKLKTYYVLRNGTIHTEVKARSKKEAEKIVLSALGEKYYVE